MGRNKKPQNKNEANSSKDTRKGRGRQDLPPARNGRAQNMVAVYVKSEDKEQPSADSSSKRINLDNARISRVRRDIEKDSKRNGSNDISWYNRNPELLRSAGSIPFASVLGEIQFENASLPTAIPGIMILPFAPAFGPDEIALNQSFNSMYSFLVHANSRNYRYNAPDLGVMIMAASQVFSIIGAMTRAYGTLKYYEERNLYCPDSLITAQGFNPTDMRNNMAQIWFDINNLIDQTKQIWVPNTLPVFERWFWLNSNIFTDAPGVTSQKYLFVQTAYYSYQEKLLDTGGCLSLVNISQGGVVNNTPDTAGFSFSPGYNTYSWTTWKQIAQLMISNLVNSEDRGIIFGDILNAYGEGSLHALPQITSDYRVEPIFNSEVLLEVENWLPTTCIITGLAQTQDGEAPELVMTWNPDGSTYWSSKAYENKLATNSVATPNQAILNFHHPEQPTPEEIAVASRFTCLGAKRVNGYTTSYTNNKGALTKTEVVIPRAFGTEIPYPVITVQISANASGSVASRKTVQRNVTLGTYSTEMNRLGTMMAFDWHPFIYVQEGFSTYATDATTIRATSNAYGDYDNYTFVDSDILEKLHRVCAFSEFGVPHI